MKTVKEILKDWLCENKYDGLYDLGMGDGGCGCLLDDLCPCNEPWLLDCVPGYKHASEDSMVEFMIRPEKPGEGDDE